MIKTIRLSRALGMVAMLFVCSVGTRGAMGDYDWDPEVRGYLSELLTESEIQELTSFFGTDQPLPGPVPADAFLGEVRLDEWKALMLRRYLDTENQIYVTPDAVSVAIEGTGTRDDPYRGLVAAAVQELAEPRGPTLVVPAGYYEEVGIELPRIVALRGEEGAVLVAPADVGDARDMVVVNRSSVVGGFVFDGSRVEYDRESGGVYLSAIRVAEGRSLTAVVDNVIRDMPGYGVHGEGGRGGPLILGNDIERVDWSGIRTRHGWVVINNRIRYAGIRRDGPGALGDDAIIIARGENTRVMHNFVFQQRAPNARHGMATHNAHRNIFENNVIISKGHLRGGIRLSDASNHNTVRRNLIMGIADATGSVAVAVRFNGAHNEGSHNAVYFPSHWGFRTWGWVGTTHNTLHNNRVALDGTAFSYGLFDQAFDNIELDVEAVRRR